MILIGMYLGTIGVPQIPFSLPSLTFFQVFESDRPANLTLRVRIQSLDTGQVLAEGMGMMTIPKPGAGVAPIRFGQLQFSAVGSYNFVATIEGEAPIITQFDVVIQPQPGQPGGSGSGR
jgi:hypothetical protein